MMHDRMIDEGRVKKKNRNTNQEQTNRRSWVSFHRGNVHQSASAGGGPAWFEGRFGRFHPSVRGHPTFEGLNQRCLGFFLGALAEDKNPWGWYFDYKRPDPAEDEKLGSSALPFSRACFCTVFAAPHKAARAPPSLALFSTRNGGGSPPYRTR